MPRDHKWAPPAEIWGRNVIVSSADFLIR